MIPLEGRALPGLDEFMLRVGHLSAASDVALTDGGSAYRFERAVTERFTEIVAVPPADNRSFARYLRMKGLCPTEKDIVAESSDTPKYRYPDLRIVDPEGPNERVISNGEQIFSQWQDYCLSAPAVPSKVGAVSFGGKRGSKTGLSHLFDWGGMLDLFNDSGTLTTFGQLLAQFRKVSDSSDKNPYRLGAEKIILGLLAIRDDFDVFAALVTSYSRERGILRKKDATQHYIDSVAELAERAEDARHLSQGRRQVLFSLWREIRPKRDVEEGSTSTAWHRTAARIENYVDLGLMSKGESEQFEYKYRVSEALLEAKNTLDRCSNADEWIDKHLADVLFGKSCSDSIIEPTRLEVLLIPILSILSRPLSPLPLDVITAGVVALSADRGQAVSVGAARRSLENFAQVCPDRARLSAGSTSRAEYISVNARLLSKERG